MTTNNSPVYVLKAVIVECPPNESKGNGVTYVYTGVALAIMKSDTDKSGYISRYLKAQRDFCESYLENCDESGLEQTFNIAAQSSSIDNLAADASRHKGSKVELSHFCTIRLLKEKETYLPSDIILEFYEDVAGKELVFV